jgi:predicted phage baseplate assembly protein
VLIADSTGAGTAATVTATAALLTATSLDAPPGALRTPLGVLFNLLAFTRGQTVSREVLGSGDPTIANQAFSLAKSPLTYLRLGGVPTSTLSVTVDGAPWTEVASFFGQSPAARVFTTAQDGAGRTQLQFGDGVTGARLPAGTGNLVATYRFGAGAASPPAGALTVIAKPFPGLRALVNPIAAGGGADPDPPAQLRDTAPRSVLTFGRAVSTLDFEAIAAIAAPGIPVSAGWAWNATSRSGAVTVYVAGDATATATVANALATCGDPNRPVVVRPASPLPVALAFALVVEAGADPTQVSAAVTAALTDPAAGPFGARLGIGQPVFDSQVVTACQGVAAVLAVTSYGLTCAGAVTNGPVHTPPAGAYFTLSPADITITAQQVADGG